MRMTASDENLALAAAGGDAEAFEALLTRHYDRLFALAFRLTGARAEAEDGTDKRLFFGAAARTSSRCCALAT
jgi:RNA polymerase sigma-70 factor (ECF subfamily)